MANNDRLSCMEFYDEGHAAGVLEELFRQQQEATHLCDVTLRVDDEEIPAHGSVLSACSHYFRTLLNGNFDDCRAREYDIPSATHSIVLKVVQFMYTGRISISMEEVQEILGLADYLCIEKLKDHCTTFLKENINDEECMLIKLLADKYSLNALVEQTTEYIAPRFGKLLDGPDAMDLPVEFVIQMLKDPNLNYIQEQKIFEFVLKWIKHDEEARIKFFGRLFICVELSYLSRTFILGTLVSDSLIKANLGADILEVIANNAVESQGRTWEEVIICRSRNVNMGDEVQLLCYTILEDRWKQLRLPEAHVCDGLESMVHHMNGLYLLVSKVADMYGYMHHTEETKFFWKFDLRKNTWDRLPEPKTVKGICRLVSHVNGIYVVDRGGKVEEYNCDTNTWNPCNDQPFFDYPSATWYVMPMPVPRYIYILRVYSSGHSFSYAQLSFRLYKFDTVHKTCEGLADIEAGDMDMEDHERLHGYVARPGAITLKNELGESRLRYDLRDGHWSSRKARIVLPLFVKEVWGSVEWVDRIYFAGKTHQESPVFMMYDYARSRFKATSPPPTFISGLLCHVLMPKTTLARMSAPAPFMGYAMH